MEKGQPEPRREVWCWSAVSSVWFRSLYTPFPDLLLYLSTESEFLALQLRMQEAEARLAETLVRSVQTKNLTETTSKDAVVSTSKSSGSKDPEQLSILEKRIKEWVLPAADLV
jgi:hypothetical protein